MANQTNGASRIGQGVRGNLVGLRFSFGRGAVASKAVLEHECCDPAFRQPARQIVPFAVHGQKHMAAARGNDDRGSRDARSSEGRKGTSVGW